MKPEDVTQDDWDKACDVLTTVTNNNHCWGIFDGAPEGYTNELHIAVAREICEARSQAFEEASKIADEMADYAKEIGDRYSLIEDVSQAIRQHSQKGRDTE